MHGSWRMACLRSCRLRPASVAGAAELICAPGAGEDQQASTGLESGGHGWRRQEMLKWRQLMKGLCIGTAGIGIDTSAKILTNWMDTFFGTAPMLAIP